MSDSREVLRGADVKAALAGERPAAEGDCQATRHAPLVEQLRAWAEDLETETDAVSHAALVAGVGRGLRQVADDLEREGRDA